MDELQAKVVMWVLSGLFSALAVLGGFIWAKHDKKLTSLDEAHDVTVKTLLGDYYTKEGVHQYVSLTMKPLEVALENNTKAQLELTQEIRKLNDRSFQEG